MSTGPSLYYEGYGSYGCPKNFLTIKPLKEVEKIIASLESVLLWVRQSRLSKNFFSNRTPKEIEKKIASSEKLTPKRLSSGPSLYYDGFGSYVF